MILLCSHKYIEREMFHIMITSKNIAEILNRKNIVTITAKMKFSYIRER